MSCNACIPMTTPQQLLFLLAAMLPVENPAIACRLLLLPPSLLQMLGPDPMPVQMLPLVVALLLQLLQLLGLLLLLLGLLDPQLGLLLLLVAVLLLLLLGLLDPQLGLEPVPLLVGMSEAGASP